jgi:hypothetical protein
VIEGALLTAGPLPEQAVRHMIAVYPPELAGEALSAGAGNHLGAFGGPVAAMERAPDHLLLGEVRTTIRVVAASGVVSVVLLWRHGPLVAQLAISGDETLGLVLLGHASQVADWRLVQLLGVS